MARRLPTLAALSILFSPAACKTGQETSERASARAASPKGRTSNQAPQCDDNNPERNLYFGDLHLHTSYSWDAYGFGTRVDPWGAYSFAKGGTVELTPVGGMPRFAQLQRPLDFAAVTDHSERFGDFPPGMFTGMQPRLDAWQHLQMAAEDNNDTTPACTFTALIAYEWTGSNWRHRNVIFRNSTVPALAISSVDRTEPSGLWTALEAQCLDAGNGCDVIAIPHNSNHTIGADGMFLVDGITPAQAEQRARLEKLAEIHQHKGNSECKRGVQTDDRWCDFYPRFDVDCVNDPTRPRCTPNAYVRNALRRGLEMEESIGTNPLKLGIIGSTDTHNGTPGATDEDVYFGHHGRTDAEPSQRLSVAGTNQLPGEGGGLTAVWAEENSREGIFSALKRREVYGTSGSRPIVRFFGGWTLSNDLCARPDLVTAGYQDGVPMGGDLPAMPVGADAPVFVASVMKDPGTAQRTGTPLQHVQIIKGYIDPATGMSREQVYVVAGDPDNGATVDPVTCQTSGPGSDSLCVVWSDPDFDPASRAFYYVRVLENPTCSIYQYDCNRIDPAQRPALCTNGQVAMSVQHRAWSSPIWFSP